MADVQFSKGVYKWTDKDGNKHVSDQAPPLGVLASDVATDNPEFKDNKCKGLVYTTEVQHKQVEDCIKKIKKAVKAPDYLEQAEKLKYVKDQKLDPYKSFTEYKRLDKILTTPGPTPDVLDTRGRIVPPKETTYSNSKLGQHLKVEDARAAKEGVKSQAEAITAARGVTKSVGVAISRALGPVLDVGIAALDPQAHSGAGAIKGMADKKKYIADGTLTPEEGDLLPGMYARGEYSAVRDLIAEGIRRKSGQ